MASLRALEDRRCPTKHFNLESLDVKFEQIGMEV